MNDKLPELRNFCPDDADGVKDLWTGCGLVRSWNDPLKDITRKLTDRNGVFWVAEDPVGVIIAAVLAFYERLGYAFDKVHFLGKRLIPDD